MKNLGLQTQQLITVSSLGGVSARMQTFNLENGVWKLQKSYPAVVGLKGFAAEGEKKEGDKKTPSGVFELGQVWGYSEAFQTPMPYRLVTDEDKFIDDVNSKEYNTWVHGPTSAKSFEKMRRKDSLYEYGLVINYNMRPIVPGKGSAIFMHIWQSKNAGTDGCVALEKRNLIEVLRWLEPSKNPLIALNLRVGVVQ
jgi:L,D-peptidoglycan transpeptidase YkuD (ErfK/YbiS/YcfS/YnhG family)